MFSQQAIKIADNYLKESEQNKQLLLNNLFEVINPAFAPKQRVDLSQQPNQTEEDYYKNLHHYLFHPEIESTLPQNDVGITRYRVNRLLISKQVDDLPFLHANASQIDHDILFIAQTAQEIIDWQLLKLQKVIFQDSEDDLHQDLKALYFKKIEEHNEILRKLKVEKKASERNLLRKKRDALVLLIHEMRAKRSPLKFVRYNKKQYDELLELKKLIAIINDTFTRRIEAHEIKSKLQLPNNPIQQLGRTINANFAVRSANGEENNAITIDQLNQLISSLDQFIFDYYILNIFKNEFNSTGNYAGFEDFKERMYTTYTENTLRRYGEDYLVYQTFLQVLKQLKSLQKDESLSPRTCLQNAILLLTEKFNFNNHKLKSAMPIYLESASKKIAATEFVAAELTNKSAEVIKPATPEIKKPSVTISVRKTSLEEIYAEAKVDYPKELMEPAPKENTPDPAEDFVMISAKNCNKNSQSSCGSNTFYGNDLFGRTLKSSEKILKSTEKTLNLSGEKAGEVLDYATQKASDALESATKTATQTFKNAFGWFYSAAPEKKSSTSSLSNQVKKMGCYQR